MARSISEIQLAISNLEKLLDTSANTVSVDGNTTVFDLKAAKDRLKELRDELSAAEGNGSRRPMFRRIDMS